MRTIQVIIFLLSSLTVLAQSDKELCESGVSQAQAKLAHGQIFFPRSVFKSTETLRKIVKMDYGIIDAHYNDYDFGFEREENCFDSIMLKAISDKWGKDFLAKQRQLANKFIKEDKGYKTPRPLTMRKLSMY